MDLGNGLMAEGMSNTVLAVQKEEAALNKRCMDPGKTGYLFKLARGDHGNDRFNDDPRVVTTTALTNRSRGASDKRREEQISAERAQTREISKFVQRQHPIGEENLKTKKMLDPYAQHDSS